METQDKKLKILRGKSTFRGLSNKTKHGPLQTHETVPLKWDLGYVDKKRQSKNWNNHESPSSEIRTYGGLQQVLHMASREPDPMVNNQNSHVIYFYFLVQMEMVYHNKVP